MQYRRIETNEQHLLRVSKKCRLVYLFFVPMLIADVIAWVIFGFLALINLLDPERFVSDGSAEFNLFLVVIFGLVSTCLIFTITVIFKSISSGEAPFSKVQVKRIRLVAVLLIVFLVVDSVVASSFSTTAFGEQLALHSSSAHVDSGFTLSINIGIVIAAVIVYSFSVLFEYGTVLQEQSDTFI